MKMEEMLQLIEAVSASELTEFKYEENGTKLSLKKAQQMQINEVTEERKSVVEGRHATDTATIETSVAERGESREKPQEGQLIVSPLVGTFYAAPAEDAESFVKVGDRIETGQVVGIVEAMKLMNEIESECAGTVTEILVENGEPIEYGQPLFRITV